MGYRRALSQPSRQMADKMHRLLVGNLGGRRQRSPRAFRHQAGAIADGVGPNLLAKGERFILLGSHGRIRRLLTMRKKCALFAVATQFAFQTSTFAAARPLRLV